MQAVWVYVIFIAAVLWLLAIWPGRGRRERMEVFSRQGIAHRGLHNNKGSAPENSMAAFRLAVEKGYGIELDVRLSGDGDLVIMHDPVLKRACKDERAVNQVPVSELRKMKLFKSEETIPLFRDVLDEIGGRVPLIVEIKAETRKEAPVVSEQVAFWLDSYEGPMCIESFNPAVVRWYKKNRPETLRGQLSEQFDKKDDISPLGGFLLSCCVCNFLTRPDFIAYNKNHRNLIRFRILRNLFHTCCAAWTIRSAEEWKAASADFDVMIFEKFEPWKTFGGAASGKGSSDASTVGASRNKERDMSEITRIHVIVSGRVQGVGFRYRAVNIAHLTGVTGWVRNMSDERVEMELQGRESAVRDMMKRLGEQRHIEIDRVIEEERDPVPSEFEFKVRY